MPNPSNPDGPAPRVWELDAEHVHAINGVAFQVRDGVRFRLILMQYGDRVYREAVMRQLAAMGVETVILEVDPAWEDTRPMKAAFAELPTQPRPLHLLGLDAWLRAGPPDGYRYRMLNYGREAWCEAVGRPLLLWLEREAMDRLAVEAPDLWAWRTMVADFIRIPPPQPPQGLVQPEFNWASLPEAEKTRARMEEITRYLEERPGESNWMRASLLRERGNAFRLLGAWTAARGDYEQARAMFERHDDPRSAIMAGVSLANIARMHGDPVSARRLLEEGLAFFTRLGDDRSLAGVQLDYADLLISQGAGAQALALLREETEPVFRRLDLPWERAQTLSRIADILTDRGEWEEALRIRRQEELPVYERLGDVRAVAVSKGKVADILAQRGEWEEALRIRRQEVLPVFERLGDARSVAVSKGKIADILTQRGEWEEALRLRREEELPVYEQLGDLRELALTRNKIARLLWTQKGRHLPPDREILAGLRQAWEAGVQLQDVGLLASGGSWLGEALMMLGQRGEAEPILRTALEAARKLGWDNDIKVIEALLNPPGTPGASE